MLRLMLFWFVGGLLVMITNEDDISLLGYFEDVFFYECL